MNKKLKQKILGEIRKESNSNGHFGLKPIDLTEPIPFRNELQFLYDNIELRLGQIDRKIIVIANTTHGEGSSTIASYFAYLLAKGFRQTTQSIDISSSKEVRSPSKNILLVDGNFRRPSIHRLFKLKNETGLAELLQNEVNLEQTINKLEKTNLTIITSGKSVDNPMKIFQAESLKRILELFKSNYFYIIIDSTPILPYFDSLAITKFCDGLVLNIRAGTTRREIVLKAKTKLIDANISILGVILNRREYYIPKFIYNHI